MLQKFSGLMVLVNNLFWLMVCCSIGHNGHERLIEATIIVQFIFRQFHKGALYALPTLGLIKGDDGVTIITLIGDFGPQRQQR
jgi:hypothetical protein